MRKRTSAFNYLVLLCAASLISCVKASHDSTNDFSSIDYNTEIDQSFLQLTAKSCNSCHGSSSTGLGGVSGTDDIFKLISSGLVAPGNLENSRLLTVISESRMPPGAPLDQTDQDLVAAWIMSLSDRQPSDGTQVMAKTFTEIYSEIIGPKCATCHDDQDDIPLTTYNQVKDIVWDGSPSASLLWESVASGRMPQGGPVLNQAEVDDIEDWIRNGAIDN